MKPEVRARATELEIDARRHPPADAVNRLAVYAAQLEYVIADLQAALTASAGAPAAVVHVAPARVEGAPLSANAARAAQVIIHGPVG